MKNLLLILFTGLLLSCSSSDDKEETIPNITTKIQPPEWIKGKWKYVSNGVVKYNGFTFYDNMFTKFTDVASSYQTGEYTVEEIKTETVYNVTLKTGETQSKVFKFTKLSSTQIKWENPDSGYANVFNKQP
jgi:hypothetical protein